MKYLTLKEMHKEQVQMLKAIIHFFTQNKIRYFICGGTLLGAIRHGGFIPWDDDVDLLLPRPSYEKFLNKIKENGYYIAKNLKVISYDFNTMNLPYAKVTNETLQIDNDYKKDEMEGHLWIDIFPMDGVPENKIRLKLLYKKAIFYRKMALMLASSSNNIDSFSSSKTKRYLKKVLRFLLKGIPASFFAKRLDKVSKKYSYNKSEYVAGVVWGYGPEERLKKEKLKDIKVKFENLDVNTFSCYEEYLTNLYGDYMKLPPVAQRQTHNIKIYKSNVKK